MRTDGQDDGIAWSLALPQAGGLRQAGGALRVLPALVSHLGSVSYQEA